MRQSNIKTILTYINYTFKVRFFFVFHVNNFKDVKRQTNYKCFDHGVVKKVEFYING